MDNDNMDADLHAEIRNCSDNDWILALVQLRKIQASLGKKGMPTIQYADKLREIGLKTTAEQLLLNVEDLTEDKQWYRSICLGRLYEDKGDYSVAEKWYRLATEQHPHSTASWIYLGAILSKMERFGEALKVLEIAITKEGDLDEAHVNIGNCLRALGDYVRAASHYEIAVQKNPADTYARNALEDVRQTFRIMAKYKLSDV